MAEIITGDTTKGIKGVGELALRISKFDSYRLFTLYENVKERKLMDVSGGQRYYLVFRSPKKEIRIPEYDPKGFFEVDKVNGCVLFKITKKNAEDILSMRTAGEKIFHIIRVFEERDEFGRVLNVTDEVEVYNGKWGDDHDFSSFSTENKVDLLTKALATQIDRNAKLLEQYNELNELYNKEVEKSTNLEKELEAMRAERDSLQTQLNEILGNTYDGTLLSTDTKYIAFENTLDNISFTEEQFNTAMNDLMTKGEFNVSNLDLDDPTLKVKVNVNDSISNLKITVYQNNNAIGSATYNNGMNRTVEIGDGDIFKFVCEGKVSGQTPRKLYLKYNSDSYSVVTTDNSPVYVYPTSSAITLKARVSFTDTGGDDVYAVGNMGVLDCYIDVQ
jgi:hypothetical protein